MFKLVHYFSEVSSKLNVTELFCLSKENTSLEVGVATFLDGVSASAPSVNFSVALEFALKGA